MFFCTEEMECSLYDLIFQQHVCLLIDISRYKRIALDIAYGIEYLHSLQPALIHRDLKCGNALVNFNNN